MQLEFSGNGLDPWELDIVLNWAPVVVFGNESLWSGFHYRVRELGGNVDYTGTSNPSNEFVSP